jgi:tetratricopeptide (TPR) repeat protein
MNTSTHVVAKPATRYLRGLWAACLCAGFVTTSHAQRLENISSGERALLPPFCEETMGFKQGADGGTLGPNSGYWISLMGRSFRTMHHYCNGLVKERRAFAPGQKPADRTYLLGSAIDEFNYVINNSDPSFIMLPEVLTKRADIQVILARYAEAIESYRAAIASKRDYWRAYSRWAATLDQMNSRKSALGILEEGIRAIPADTRLRAQYKQLGGDLAKLPAAPVAAADKASQPAPAASTATLPASSAGEPAAPTGASAPAQPAPRPQQ